jgi:putative transposase
VARLCKLVEVTRGGYYAWRNRWASAHRMRDAEILERMRRHFEESRGTYGSPRLHALLKREGLRTSTKRVARLMQVGDLKARAARIYRRMPGTTAFFAKVPNRLPEQITKPNQVWVGDITFLRVPGSWRYLAAVMDKYSRRIVGWSLGGNRTTAITVAAFDRAVANRRPPVGLIYHSDRGVEYGGYAFADRLKKLGVTQSMNRPKSMNDNAHMESFFHSLKSEELAGRRFASEAELLSAIRSYIPRYNAKRPHSSLGYLSPIDYEQRAA